MKKTICRIATALTAVVAAGIFPSCERDIIYNWKSGCQIVISPVYDMLYDRPEKAPSLFRVLLYDPVSHNLVSSNMVGGCGGNLYNVRPGTYDILVYNYTLNKTKVTHEENLSLMQAGTPAIAYKATPIVQTPSHLFVEKFDDVVIPHLTDNDEPFVIHSKPRSVIESWILIIDGIKGLRNADYIDIYISGQSQASFIAKDAGSRANNVNATICFQAVCDYEKGLICTPFTTFGKIPDERVKLELNIRIVGSGGEVYSCSEDVTGQFDNSDNLRHEIKATFDVTIEGRHDGGMNPSAEPWDPDVDSLILR